MIQIYPEYKNYDPNIPDVLIQEQIGKNVIYYYAHNITSITFQSIEAEIIYLVKTDLIGKLPPTKSVNTACITMENSKIYLLNDNEANDVSTKIALNKLFTL